jgi:peptidoglycan/xylan/chitin deacetylase (PgdA/CDA1 family)
MTLSRAMKRAAVAAGRLLPEPDPATRRVVLCYHSVHPDRAFVSTRPHVFERHVEWLHEHCEVVPLVELVADDAMNHNRKPRAAITFDDGYADNHSYALPILAKYGMHATFFVTAGFVERNPAVIGRFHQLAGGARDITPLDWTQIRELSASGMHIGSHTYSHPNLARLSRAEVEDELRKSKDVIGNQLGAVIDLFAYPFGKPRVHVTSVTTAIAEAVGYRMAAAVMFRGVLRTDSPFRIPRFFVDGDSIEKLDAKVRGAYELVGWWQEHVPLSVLKLVSPDDFRW